MKKTILFALAIFIAFGAMAQRDDVQFIILDDASHNSNLQGPGSGIALFDNGSAEGSYSGGHDYWITVTSTCGLDDTTGTLFMSVLVNTYDIGCRDTVYIYDGPDIYSPLIVKFNNCMPLTDAVRFYVSAGNPTGAMTIRFRSVVPLAGDVEHDGFHMLFECTKPCERIYAVIDSVFDRTDLITGGVIGHGRLKWVPQAIDTNFYAEYDTTYVETLDTVWTDDSTYTLVPITETVIDTILFDSILGIDTLGMVWAALLCEGEGARFYGHGVYTHNTGYYFPADTNTRFEWTLGADNYAGIGATFVNYDGFQQPGCNEVKLHLVDQNQCQNEDAIIQTRVSPNPIKTIFDLSDICNTDSLMVRVGYSGENGTLTLKKITYNQSVSKVNNVRQFIPDGPRCEIPCFSANVDFTGEFPAGKVVRSADEICSICINYEHTYMGDYRVAIRCPIYDENVSPTIGQAVLKYGKYGAPDPLTGSPCSTCDPLAPPDSPDGTGAGGSTDTGWPHFSNDNCDSVKNPFGIGLDYCWSRNQDYTLITGDLADVPTRFQPGQWYISTSNASITEEVTLPTMPSYFLTPGGGTHTSTTRQPSNHEDKLDYYSPSSDFSELIGCPLTGIWQAVICDFWGGDNGWVFSWSLDICGLSQGAGGCDYQVGIDSVIWRPDTNLVTDFRDGVYRGLHINKRLNDSTAAYISSPDTSGTFRIRLSIYDEFGCRWDTLTKINTVHTPRPSLGNDTMLCGADSIILDATDKFAPRFDYRYLWEPYGDSTATIATRTGEYGEKTYVVEVINSNDFISCPARDTIVLSVNPQPIPNFDPGVFPLEGCEPFTINITNTTNFGHKYHWVFGDGTYSTLKNPSHSYATGTYDFKYYVESDKGCKDSLIYTDLITVFPSPEAKFSWDPVFPTVLHPSISLINNTTPDDGHNKYFWEIQYDKNNPYSFHTVTDNSTTFRWTAQNDEDVSGSYTVRLLARYEQYAPSGRLIQCADTVENTILLINDNIIFPNVVTPNGDGINDRFVIGNLVEGLAYPINQLDIYDKWGSRVFHAVNIQREDQFWDPAKTNTPAGTYFYRFSGKGYKGDFEHNGVIEVLK